MQFIAQLASRSKFVALLCCTVLLIVTLSISHASAAVWQITYPKALNEGSKDFSYVVKLLELSLSKTGVRYTVTPTDDTILQHKALNYLKDNRQVNVVWSMTDKQRESDLLPIRIPIYKGLIGWRVLLMHTDNRTRFARLEAGDLMAKNSVQGMNWPDTKILRANGFSVINATDYAEVFQTMQREQADFLPRSVIEVTGEMENAALTKNLVLEENYVLRYPAAAYFFVNKQNKILAKLLQRGLAMAIADGSFDQLFTETYMPMLRALNVPDRVMLNLANPLLPEATPLSNPALWFEQ